jgi:Arc/MetJ family transcription regulator
MCRLTVIHVDDLLIAAVLVRYIENIIAVHSQQLIKMSR